MTEPLSVSSIPHRPPFLFVDKIVDVSNDRIVTSWFVDPDSNFFQGHYPSEPLMPGVLICESCFQAGALLITHRLGGYDSADGVPVLARIRDAKFKQIVRPGQTLDVEVTLDEELADVYFMTGRARVDGALVVRVTFACKQTQPGTEDEVR